MVEMELSLETVLPEDGAALLVGRVWCPGDLGGPVPVLVEHDSVTDLSELAPTLAQILAMDDPAAIVRRTQGTRLGDTAAILANSRYDVRRPETPYFLAPADLTRLRPVASLSSAACSSG